MAVLLWHIMKCSTYSSTGVLIEAMCSCCSWDRMNTVRHAMLFASCAELCLCGRVRHLEGLNVFLQ